MNPDFWKPINVAEFNDRTGHTYQPATTCSIALEHWVEMSGVLLGVIVIDRVDSDYGYVVLGRDEHGQFRAIEAAYSHSIDGAREALYSTMHEILASGASVFPQDCLQ
jgi:hypothetical protein